MKGTQLPKSTFKAEKKEVWSRLRGVYGFNSAPTWHSPGATAINGMYADFLLVDFLNQWGCHDLVDSAWLLCVARAIKRKVVIRDVRKRIADGQWFFPLVEVQSVGMLLWRAEEKVFSGQSDARYFDLALDHKGAEMAFVLDLSNFEAQQIQWRSPLSQLALVGELQETTPDQVRVRALAVPGMQPEALVQVEAKLAFGNLPLSTLRFVADHLGAPRGDSLFLQLQALVEHCLNCGEECVLEYLKLRCASLGSEGALDELMQDDDIFASLDADDKAEVEQSLKTQRSHKRVVTEFRQEWVGRVRVVKQRAKAFRKPKATATPKAKAKAMAAAIGYRGPANFPDLVPQSEARQYVPPGASVWRGNKALSWNGHLPPNARTSRSWALYGANGALKLVLQALWKQWLFSQGLTEAECPIVGLFDGRDG